MNKRDDSAGYIVLALIVLPIMLFLVFYRSTKTVVVDQRYWHYTIQVGHYETNIHVDCDKDGCTTRTTRDWETTCTQSSTGRELPPVAPELRCRDRDQREYIVYRLEYHKEDEAEHGRATFGRDLWQYLEPGSVLTVKMNALDRVTEIKEIHND